MSENSLWFGESSRMREALRPITRNVAVNGVERRYDLFVPPTIDVTKEAPLIMGLHGAGSMPAHFAYISQLHRRAGSLGYVVAYPAAEGGFWLRAQERPNDDLLFVEIMLQDIASQVRIDPQRVYAIGMSNGGQMVYKLACERSDIITAIAVCAAGMRPGLCYPTHGVPVIHFHGTEDPIVPYAWGEDAVRQWIKFNGCDPVGTETFRNGSAFCVTYRNVSTGARVILCTFQGGGHQYPGVAIRLTESETKLLGLPQILSRLGPGTDDVDATGMSLSFFGDYPRHVLAEEGKQEI
jgi:polyhydroxybutyrate depolymerase